MKDEDFNEAIKALRKADQEHRFLAADHSKHTDHHYWGIFCGECNWKCIQEFFGPTPMHKTP